MTTSRLNRRRLTPLVCALVLTLVLTVPIIAQAEEDHAESGSTSQAIERSSKYENESDPKNDEETEARMTKERSVTPKDASRKNVSPLVKAANSSKKKKSSARSFTDADLSRSKGKLIVIEGTNVREPEIIPIEKRSPEVLQSPGSEQKMDAVQRQAAAKALTQQIATLETELRKLETEYYMIEEEDHREVVERTFDEKRKALADAKEKLSKVQSGGSE